MDHCATRLFVFGALTVGAAAGLLPTLPAYAGYLIDEGPIEVRVSNGRILRVGHTATMLNVRTGRLWMTGFKKPVYWEGTVDDYCRIEREQWLTSVLPMREAEAKKSPEERAARAAWIKAYFADVEERLRRMGISGGEAPRPFQVMVERTLETATIAGQLTRKYRVLLNGKLYEELWLTTDPALAHELSLQSAPETWGRYWACMLEEFGGVEESPEYRQLFAYGWPLKIISYQYAGEAKVERREVIKVEQRDFPEGDFDTPGHLTKVPPAELFD